jgi:hypothetical protein
MTQIKKKRMGRPPLPKNEAKKVFSLRLSAIEQNRIETAAKRAGEPVTQWARTALLRAATPDLA